MNKSDLIKDLTQIKTRHLERLHNIEKEITSTLAATENTAPPEAKVFDDSRSAQFVNAQVLNLRTLLLEEKYRLQFIDQLIFQCDSHYEGQELSGFFHITLQKMAKVSATAEQAQAWKFIHQTAMAMKSLSERRENPLEFISGYLNTSPFLEPVEISQYLKRRDYTNAHENYTAQTISKERVGNSVREPLSQ
ncbi:MAG: hypothetical protein H6626_04570 [Pseudobdellovibrionaceae bacterium]|nr:hypothetical protein [Bdellovibrionales bacterium]USN48368.1 MAG: hypothetical protein H6626_04570 [Pseudobdellovibrionaceae bacterium]